MSTQVNKPVVPGCAGCAMAHPDFDRSVGPISTKGDRLCPPNYYWHTQMFRPSDGPAKYTRTHTFLKDRQSKNRIQADRISNAPFHTFQKVIY